jgi:uncharacterized protein YjbI with pentapeptide repeats
MTAKLRSWWQYIRKHWIVAIIVVFVVLMALIFVGYWFDWTGFNGYNKVTITHIISGTNAGTVTKTEEYQPGKALWDWLQLLGVLTIPVVVGLGAAWYTAQQGKVSDRENTDNQRETALQKYIDSMSELLLHEKLRESAEDEKSRKIARVRTLTVLPRLDSVRKRSVLLFLYESGLIEKDKLIINLDGADLSGADLSRTNLNKANLYGVALTGVYVGEADLPKVSVFERKYQSKYWRELIALGEADSDEVALPKDDLGGVALSGANLSKANLFRANLGGADLFGANLSGANLSRAYLGGANLRRANLGGADLFGAKLSRATLGEASLRDADLRDADLRDADLGEANLFRADLGGDYVGEASLLSIDEVPTFLDQSSYRSKLSGANLSKANLRDAKVATKQLDTARSLLGAIMPDGSAHP